MSEFAHFTIASEVKRVDRNTLQADLAEARATVGVIAADLVPTLVYLKHEDPEGLRSAAEELEGAARRLRLLALDINHTTSELEAFRS